MPWKRRPAAGLLALAAAALAGCGGGDPPAPARATALAATAPALARHVLPRQLLHMPPQATTAIRLSVELDRRLPAMDPDQPFDPLDATTYNKATGLPLWSAQGTHGSLAVYFRRMAGLDDPDSGLETWWVQVSYEGRVAQAWQALRFGPDGRQLDGADSVLNLLAGDAGLPQAVDLDLSGCTLEARGFSVSELWQNGHAAGRLQSVTPGGQGLWVLHYDNGQTRTLGPR
jgi:flagellar hook protein FlgE